MNTQINRIVASCLVLLLTGGVTVLGCTGQPGTKAGEREVVGSAQSALDEDDDDPDDDDDDDGDLGDLGDLDNSSPPPPPPPPPCSGGCLIMGNQYYCVTNDPPRCDAEICQFCLDNPPNP